MLSAPRLKRLKSYVVVYFFCTLHNLVAPVIIRAASIWMLSKFLFFQ